MQSAASKRMLSTLAAKLHPQLPLSPRESQQLLNLLTSSFRAHLDREHPLSPPESGANSLARRASASGNAPRSPSPSRATSSYASATRHIDSILNNPLFAVKPHRRGSGPAAADVLRDPMAWFVDQIATGAATLPKAGMCLEVLDKTTNVTPSKSKDGRTPATVITEWLRTSALDTSRQFLEQCMHRSGHGSRFLDRLIALAVLEGETDAPWRWFIRSNEQRVKETGLDSAKISAFRQELLRKMVNVEANADLNRGLATFMQAWRFVENAGHESAYAILRPAGAHLVNRIMANTDQSFEPELYQSFLVSSQRWLGPWKRAVASVLWLNHPTEPSVLPGLQFIRDPAGAITFTKSTRSRRNFLVQLCLGVARQLLEQEKFADAQVVMEFTKEHFADLVLPSRPQVAEQEKMEQWRVQKERENLELLDSLVPT